MVLDPMLEKQVNAYDAWARASAEFGQRARDFVELVQDPPSVAVGETPGEVVHTDNKVRLIRYAPLTKTQAATPVLIVYALVNRPTILDLQPDRSVVRALLNAGLDVYLVDWGTPSELDQAITLDDHVNRFIHNCARKAMDLSDAKGVTLLGYCMGGTMGAAFAALHPKLVKNLVLMAAPLDFSDTDGGLLWSWSRPEHFDVDQLVDGLGNVPPEFLNVGYQYLKPVQNTVGKWLSFWRMAGDTPAVENFLRMEKWVNDGIPIPGETYRQFIQDIYQHDRLARGEMMIDGARVDIANLTMPVLGVVGHYDHLVPMGATIRFLDKIPAKDQTVFDEKTGHIGLSVSSKSHRALWPRVAEWILARS